MWFLEDRNATAEVIDFHRFHGSGRTTEVHAYSDGRSSPAATSNLVWTSSTVAVTKASMVVMAAREALPCASLTNLMEARPW